MEKFQTAACAAELATSYRGPIRESRSISLNMQSASTDLSCARASALRRWLNKLHNDRNHGSYFSLLLQFTACDGHLGSFRLDNVVR